MSDGGPPHLTQGELIARVGARLGLAVHFETAARHSGQIAAPDGRRFYFAGTRTDLNGSVAAAIADDKELTAYYLLRTGYPVPTGRAFGRDEVEAASDYARDLGYPVVVRPSRRFRGGHASLVADERQLRQALQAMLAGPRCRRAIVQEKVAGNEFRIIVLDGEVLAAYQRIPLSVVGDGHRSIAALLEEKIAGLRARARPLILSPRDERVSLRLAQMGLTWETVPGAGERIQLLDTASGSTGSDLVDLTDTIHPEAAALSARIARAAGLRFCALDLLAASIGVPLRDYTVSELDGSPALHHLLGSGLQGQRRAESIVERMLRAMTGG